MKNRIKVNIDFSAIEQSLSNGDRVTVKQLAEKYGVSSPTMQQELQEKYTTSIAFNRGRQERHLSLHRWLSG